MNRYKLMEDLEFIPRKELVALEKERDRLKDQWEAQEVVANGYWQELQALKELMEENLEIYRHLMETDKGTTQYQKGKIRGAFFAYKSMLDSIPK